ncbi:MAG: glycosyltransferase involved in cell wall biosynthesis [Cyclobacteriaceae bacterium]|jgi:glycosyltransferase involved in cell wall biosynthesis
MIDSPLVSVICLCYNHERFVREVINSVLSQSYSNVQLIVVDDASTDGSKSMIAEMLEGTSIEFINLGSNLGNTKAFNQGLSEAKGKYIIDLAADDVLVQNRIEKQVAFFEECEQTTGVIYSDAIYIDEDSNELNTHFSNMKLTPFTGDIYEKVISKYFISPPTMMMKSDVLRELDGYDENLAYEDFDFWIRSSRKWQYEYQAAVLTKVRKTEGSLSSKAYAKNDQQLHSTYLVCQKIKSLNRTHLEHEALKERLKYEIKHAVFSGSFKEAKLFIGLFKELQQLTVQLQALSFLADLKIDLSFFRRAYLRSAH